jgi:hypothetical protein
LDTALEISYGKSELQILYLKFQMMKLNFR